MDYMSISEASKVWGLSTRRIQVLCVQGRIMGASKMGYVWAIPKGAVKPVDARIKSGKYIQQKNKR